MTWILGQQKTDLLAIISTGDASGRLSRKWIFNYCHTLLAPDFDNKGIQNTIEEKIKQWFLFVYFSRYIFN